MNFVFDLDGTLIDTKEATYQAYKHVGINMPDEAWGLPWYEWLDSADIHDEKTKIYPEMLKRHAKILPTLNSALEVDGFLLTSASISSVMTIFRTFNFILPILGTSCNNDLKINRLNKLKPGLCIDDNVIFGELLEEHTEFKYVHPDDFFIINSVH